MQLRTLLLDVIYTALEYSNWFSNDVFHKNDVRTTSQNLPKKLKKSKPNVSLRKLGADVLS